MLFREPFKRRIRAGEVTLTFRAWKRPQAKVGGVYNLHPRGAIRVEALARTELSEITPADARRAGFASLEALTAELTRPAGQRGQLYRVEFHYLGDGLVKQPEGRDEPLGRAEYEELAVRLDRMDARAASGPWTRAFLTLIHERPATRAAQLAAALGWDPARFKANVRKLKRLGLTQSLAVGYRLSRRGSSLLDHERRSRPGSSPAPSSEGAA